MRVNATCTRVLSRRRRFESRAGGRNHQPENASAPHPGFHLDAPTVGPRGGQDDRPQVVANLPGVDALQAKSDPASVEACQFHGGCSRAAGRRSAFRSMVSSSARVSPAPASVSEASSSPAAVRIAVSGVRSSCATVESSRSSSARCACNSPPFTVATAPDSRGTFERTVAMPRAHGWRTTPRATSSCSNSPACAESMRARSAANRSARSPAEEA
jgi:hypothetical protein